MTTASTDERPSRGERLVACLLAFAPWLVLYYGVQALGRPAHPWVVGLPFEEGWPVLEWTEALYASAYAFTPLAPLLAPTRAGLRRFVVTGLVATVVVGVLWLTLPVVAVPRPFVPAGFWGRLLASERAASMHVAAFPSFHVLWALMAADAMAGRGRAWSAGAWSWATLIALSCVTTGQHAIADLVAAGLLYAPLRKLGTALSLWTPRVRIRKWYLDCVGDDGEAAIAYVGRVTLGVLTIPYLELLVLGRTGTRRWRRWSGDARVTSEGRSIAFAAPGLGASGRWASQSSPIDLVLLDDPAGVVRWRCVQPCGAGELQLPGGGLVAGSGYVEELLVGIAPWKLPFEELRWGRFIGCGRSVVWIDWRGGLERRWVFADGQPVAADRVERDRVEWSGGRLEIDAGVVVRQATIGRTLLGPLSSLLPRRLGRAVETKWLCEGRLYACESPQAVSGTVIHEVVRWA